VGSLYVSILCTILQKVPRSIPGVFAPAQPEGLFFDFAGAGELGCWYGTEGRRIEGGGEQQIL